MASEASESPVVVVLSGPSGAGKDTVLHRALELDASLATIATAKTRAPRPGERHGVNHVFLNEDEFDEWLARDDFLEHATVYGHRSGVPRAAVDACLAEGKSVIIRTDVQGARTLRERLPDSLLIFLSVPDRAMLRQRMEHRGSDSEAEMKRRLDEADAEMAEADWFDHVVMNPDGGEESAAAALVAHIQAARRRAAGGVSWRARCEAGRAAASMISPRAASAATPGCAGPYAGPSRHRCLPQEAASSSARRWRLGQVVLDGLVDIAQRST